MQAEAIGRELRRIGDDFNRLLLLRVSDHSHCFSMRVRVWERGPGNREGAPATTLVELLSKVLNALQPQGAADWLREEDFG